jgi:vacuolar protein sorting-associated protein VTA1
MYDDLPESIKSMKDFLIKADQFKKLNPVVSHYCRVYALEKGLKERDKSDRSAMERLTQLMDEVEKEKKQLGPVEDAQMQVAAV